MSDHSFLSYAQCLKIIKNVSFAFPLFYSWHKCSNLTRDICFSMRLFIEIFKLCVTVDRSGSTKLEKMIKEKSFLLLLLSATRIEERQLNFFVHGPFVPPFSLKRKLL